MTANPTIEWVPRSRPFTVEDLDRMPDDGHRYELIDGVLIVTPAPSYDHQNVASNLHLLLRAACPPELKVLFAPFDVLLAVDTKVQPDLLVAPRAQFTSRNLTGAPLLAVEILSPSTRHLDLAFKRARYEAAGCRYYWVIDPVEPSIIAWELVEGRYREQGRAQGSASSHLTQPFPIVITPAELLD